MREAATSLSIDDQTSGTRTTQVQPLADSLRSISPQAALISRVLCNAHAHMLFDSLPGIDMWDARADVPDAADPGVITIASMAGPLHLAIDLAVYPALQILSHGAGKSADSTLHNAVASVLLEGLLEQMALAGLGTWRVVAIERGTGGDRLADVALRWFGHMHYVGIDAPESTLAVFEEHVHSVARRGAAAESPEDHVPFASLSIPGRLLIGQRNVPVAALQALRPGDVLLRALLPATAVALQSGDTAFRASVAWGAPGLTCARTAVRVEGTAIIIIEEPFMTDIVDPSGRDPALFDEDLPDQQEWSDQDREADRAYPAQDADRPGDSPERSVSSTAIGELELPLQFEIDTVALPLAQIAALRPGYVLELQVPVRDARIRLVTHGQTIGHGELVALGEHLGIRILRMAHSDEPVQ